MSLVLYCRLFWLPTPPSALSQAAHRAELLRRARELRAPLGAPREQALQEALRRAQQLPGAEVPSRRVLTRFRVPNQGSQVKRF